MLYCTVVYRTVGDKYVLLTARHKKGSEHHVPSQQIMCKRSALVPHVRTLKGGTEHVPLV